MASFGERARRAWRSDWDRDDRDRGAATAADAGDERLDAAFDDWDAELAGERADGRDADGARPGEARRPRGVRSNEKGRRRTVMGAIREIPNYLRLAWGLLRDGRVSRADKLLVAAAVLYVVNPFDFIPDLIPFLGEVDDVFLIVLAIQRMIRRAGRDIVAEHWPGDPLALSNLDLAATVSAAAFFLPGGIKRRLVGMVFPKRKMRRAGR